MKLLGVAALLVFTLCLSVSGSGVEGHSTRTEETGSLGGDVTYSLDTDTHVLTIKGTGLMNNFSSYDDHPPFFGERIDTLIIEEGVENIGSFLMYQEVSYLTSVTVAHL